MNEFFRKIESFVDRVIPYLLVILLIIVILDIFYPSLAVKYVTPIVVADVVIVSVFVADLIFKYLRVRDIPKFIRLYWLDLLAVFPFFLLLRLFEEVLLLSETSSLTLRNLFHAGLVVEEDVLATEETASKVAAETSRLEKFVEIFGKFGRTPRLLKGISFFEHPSKKKTLYHKKKK